MEEAEMAEKGKFVVVEGTDGAGKTTQIKLLGRQLDATGISHRVIDFPQYSVEPYGPMIGRYLKGDFGPLYSIPPRYAALPYALDRLMAKPTIEQWQDEGHLVIANRYAPSNKAHMGAMFYEDAARAEFIKWLDEVEYTHNKIPREDADVLLCVDAEVGSQNVAKKDLAGRAYLEGASTHDIHEANKEYQGKAKDTYLYLARTEPNWISINCLADGQMRSPQDISADIFHGLVLKGVIAESEGVAGWIRRRWEDLKRRGINIEDILPGLMPTPSMRPA